VDVAAWLRDLGLERYESTFRENEIDWDVLPELTESDHVCSVWSLFKVRHLELDR
jgi:hypothetical protein